MARYVKYAVLLTIIAVGATMAYMAVAEPTAKAGGCGGGCGWGGGCAMVAKPAAAPAADCKCADGKPCTCKGECKCDNCKCANCATKAGPCASGKPCVGKDKCTCADGCKCAEGKPGACKGSCAKAAGAGCKGACAGQGMKGCGMRGAHGPKWPTKTGPERSLGEAFHIPG